MKIPGLYLKMDQYNSSILFSIHRFNWLLNEVAEQRESHSTLKHNSNNKPKNHDQVYSMEQA